MKYLRNTLLMILAAALIMPSPLVLAEGVSGAAQESKVDDVKTVIIVLNRLRKRKIQLLIRSRSLAIHLLNQVKISRLQRRIYL